MRLLILWVSFLSLNVPFAEADVPAREDAREAVRERIMSHSSSYFGPSIAPASNDNAENLVDQLFSKNLAEMESAKRMDAELPNAPWSDSYWPIYSGEIANRYADPNYRAGLNWMENRNYLISNLGRGPMEQMSAAEKYDLLVGDNAFTLTRKMISAGAPYADEKGNVETWMGLCHGWAPASIMVPRPSHTIRTKASDGREIVFYPSDLKALASLL